MLGFDNNSVSIRLVVAFNALIRNDLDDSDKFHSSHWCKEGRFMKVAMAICLMNLFI